jgi:hypothetical protein
MDYSASNDSNHDRSLSNALYRWLNEFFSSLFISAYVFSHPFGWNTGSHPNFNGPRDGTISPYISPPAPFTKPYLAYALKQQYLGARTITVREGTDRLSGFILVGGEEIV